MLSSVYGLTFAACALASNWATYPSVPKTATVNGFADPIMDNLPSCAKNCVGFSTGNTPCPYWDTGCLCVMPQWSGEVAECFMSSCKEASDLASATSAAYSLCSKVGANVWMMPASISTAMDKAVGAAGATVSSASATASDSFSNSVATSPAITSMANSASSEATTRSVSSGSTSTSSQQSSTSNGANSVSQRNGLFTLLCIVVLSILT